MIPNDDPKLKEQLSKIWQQSEERLAKAAAGKQRTAYLEDTSCRRNSHCTNSSRYEASSDYSVLHAS
jgi:hypothetical protein